MLCGGTHGATMRRMSEDQPTAPSALERCIESLAFCHTQDEIHWAAARVVAQQDIDEFMRAAGPVLADQHQALLQLMAEFERKFPHPADPVLIRSYARRQIRRIGYELQRADEHAQGTEGVSEISAPATAPVEAAGDVEAESNPGVEEPQGNS
jgi:hypothetical protein